MTTKAKAKHTPLEQRIAKELGLTDAQLDALLRIRSGYWPGNAAAILEAKGYAWRDWKTGKSGLTVAGEAKLECARSMGF